jgi:hypothetical protein
MQVCQMRNPDPFEVLEKALRTRKPTDAKPARAIVPRVALAQQLLSKLPKPFDGCRSAHIKTNVVISLNARTNLTAGVFASISKRVRLGLENGAVSSCGETAR